MVNDDKVKCQAFPIRINCGRKVACAVAFPITWEEVNVLGAETADETKLVHT